MRFSHTIVYVRDVEQSLAFYERAFGVRRAFLHESGTYGELETGETRLAFVSNELAESNLPNGFRRNAPDAPPAGVELCFTTPDVPAAYRAATAAGAVAVAEPKQKPWGQVVAYVRDPDGVLVELASPM